MKLTINEILEWAVSRETSFAIAEVIIESATDEENASSIWENPTPKTVKNIVKIAFDRRDDDELFWGVERFDRADFDNDIKNNTNLNDMSKEGLIYMVESQNKIMENLAEEIKRISRLKNAYERLFDEAIELVSKISDQRNIGDKI